MTKFETVIKVLEMIKKDLSEYNNHAKIEAIDFKEYIDSILMKYKKQL